VIAVVTERLAKAKDKAQDSAPGGADAAPLAESLRRLTETVATRAATSLTKKATAATGRLTEYNGSGGSGGLLSAVTGKAPGASRKALTGAVKGAFTNVAESVKDKIRGSGGGGGDKLKVTNIVEEIDVGVPVDLAYDQWTRFTDFPSFTKKVENVRQVTDEKVRWKAQIFWSHRTWDATIIDQVPGERIVWRSDGAKGHVDGTVTFHELTPDLTRIILVLEYYPQGLFERTGNLWRAQGRRVRLELKHFRRHVMTHGLLHPDEIEGWRGEIHDGEVVDAEQDEAEQDEAEQDEPPTDDEPVDDEPVDDEPVDDEPAEDELEGEEPNGEKPSRRRRQRAAASRK
jgi:uncharacterized membrane protein